MGVVPRALLLTVSLLAGCLAASEGGGGSSDPDADPGAGADGAAVADCVPVAFTADFEDPGWDEAWGASWEAEAGMLAAEGGRAVIITTNEADDYAAYETEPEFDFEERCVHVEVPIMMKHGDDVSSDAYLAVLFGDFGVQMGQSSGDLCCEAYDSESDLHNDCPVDYELEAHRWWRIRLEGGQVACDASADGEGWLEIDRFELTPPTFTGAVSLYGGTWDAVESAGQVEFDNLNL